jgi:hypothetical protein
VLTRIREVRQNEALPYRHKRQLIQAEVSALLKARKNEMDARLKIQELKLNADVAAAARAIDIYRNTVITRMDDEFNKFVGKLGIKVTMNKLNLLTELGDKLTVFRRGLVSSKIDKVFVDKILKQVDLAFDNMIDQLGAQVAKSSVPEDEV